MRENSWLSYTDEDDKNVEVLAQEYKEFLSKCKTERECTQYFIKEAESHGYQDLNKLIAQGTRLKAGDKVYGVGMGKTIALFQIGKQPLTEGMNILCAHIDSPRLDLKQNPLYEDTELSFMDTHYYGGIKKYQWVALPLALHGVVAKKDGTVVNVNIGEDPADPVVYVTDLLIHLAGKQMEKKGSVVVEGENLDILVGSRPLAGEEKDAEEVAKYVKDAGCKIVLLPFDLRDEQAPKEIIDKAVSELGGLDTMVLNAGQQISCQSIAELPLEQVKDTFMINIIAMFALVKEAVPHIPAGGAIVTTTSVQAFNPSEHLLDYAATKASIANFTIGLAKQLAPKGIRVNGVAPGPIWTPLQLDEGQPSDSIPEFGQQSLLERAGQPGELAPVYVFLASNKASYVTAQIYGVTGGEAINL